MDRERALDLNAAAKLAGLSLRELRKQLREGRLPSTRGADGKPRVTVGHLAEAGLLSSEPGKGAGQGVGELAPDDPAERSASSALQSWAGGEAGAVLQRLLVEREQAASAWKERTEALYRELLDDQRRRIERLEDVNGALTERLHEALRQVPKLLELDKVEAAARESERAAEQAQREAEVARQGLAQFEERARRLEDELARSEERRAETFETLERLRGRGVWARLVDSEPRLPRGPATPPGERSSN